MLQNWITIAKRLPLGQSVRVKCCKSDLSASISHSLRGYHYYCFRCHKEKFEPRTDKFTLDQFVESNKQFEQLEMALPNDFSIRTEDLPIEGLSWLVKYGIDEDLRHKYQIGYSKSTKRVLLPVYNKDKLIFLQGRAIFPDQKPKYLNKKGVFKPYFIAKCSTRSNGVVLTEDILSAIKVGEVNPAISLLGTSPDKSLIKLVQPYDKVYIWLDNDAAGLNGSIKTKEVLCLSGKKIYKIVSKRDPKAYCRAEIRQFIDGAVEWLR